MPLLDPGPDLPPPGPRRPGHCRALPASPRTWHCAGHSSRRAPSRRPARTVQRWLNAYLERGLGGLRPRRAKGAPGKIPSALADEVCRWVIDGPAKQGLDRANWTHEGLADHLYKSHGIATSRSPMRRFCQKIGIRVYRPTYRFLRGKPERQ